MCGGCENRSGCLAAWFHRALDGSDASDLLGEHPESFRIGLHQHPLNEDSEHLHLFRGQGLLGDVRDHISKSHFAYGHSIQWRPGRA